LCIPSSLENWVGRESYGELLNEIEEDIIFERKIISIFERNALIFLHAFLV